MKATIEHSFCPYCDEVTELYFRIINTILFSTDEAELRTGMERLQEKTRLDDYFVFGYGKHHLWVCQRRPSNQEKIFEHRVIMAESGISKNLIGIKGCGLPLTDALLCKKNRGQISPSSIHQPRGCQAAISSVCCSVCTSVSGCPSSVAFASCFAFSCTERTAIFSSMRRCRFS